MTDVEPVDVAELLSDPETDAAVVAARSVRGEHFSLSVVDDRSGSEEARLLAHQIAAICDRTGLSRDEFLRMTVQALNDVNDDVDVL